ncbi:hypothetical protein D9M71_744890 [compost metagenome]
MVLARQPVGHALATAAPVKGQHQGREFPRATPAGELQAEGSVPAEGRGAAALDEVELRVPAQRPVGDHPEFGRPVRGQEGIGHGRELGFGMFPGAGLGARVRLHPLDAGDELGGQLPRAVDHGDCTHAVTG